MNRMVTVHFAVHEFDCHNGVAYPEKWIETRLRPLCDMLEIIRARVGGPIKILSGYRTPEYNAKIGGAKTSQHMEGRAADIVIPPLSAGTVHDLVLELCSGGMLPSIHGLGQYPRFVHVDVRPGDRLARWTGSRVQS